MHNNQEMKYMVQFSSDWVGTWIFNAVNDIRAWEIVWDMIKDHTLIAKVNVDVIYELNDSNEITRNVPGYEDCKETDERRKRKDTEKQEEKAIYKAYFSDGECSGPYLAKVSENDAAALDMAEYKLKQHSEYNGLDITKIKVTQVEEINEGGLFTVNFTCKKEKKNRLLVV
jgi:hypothetical protein